MESTLTCSSGADRTCPCGDRAQHHEEAFDPSLNPIRAREPGPAGAKRQRLGSLIRRQPVHDLSQAERNCAKIAGAASRVRIGAPMSERWLLGQGLPLPDAVPEGRSYHGIERRARRRTAERHLSGGAEVSRTRRFALLREHW